MKQFLLALLFILVLTVSLFGNTIFPKQDEIIYGGDVLTQFYFWKSFLVESIKNGEIPFWNPYNFSGTPFLAHPSTAFFYPFTMIFFLLPINLAFSNYFFIHFIIAGLGMFRLGRNLGRFLGAAAGTAVFLLSGILSARIYAGHVEILSSIVWIPWIFKYAGNYIETGKRKDSVLFTVFLILQILASYQAVTIFTLEIILSFGLYKIISSFLIHRKSTVLQSMYKIRFGIILLSILVAAGTTAISWLPAMELVKQSIRGEGLSYSLASWGSLPISSLVLFIDPLNKLELNKIAYGFGSGSFSNFFMYYFGIVPIVLIIAGFFCKLVRGKISIINKVIQTDKISNFWFYLIIMVTFIFIASGVYVYPNIHYLLYQVFPPYKFIRIPDQHLIMVVFIAAMLTSLIVGSLKNSIVKVVVIVCIILQLFPYSKRLFFLTQIPELSIDQRIIEMLKNQNENRVLLDYRVAADPHVTFEFNAPAKYKIYSASGYDPIILRSYYEFINALNKSTEVSAVFPQYNIEIPTPDPNSPLINFLNIKYLLLAKGYKPEGIDENRYELKYTNNLVTLYENKNVLPRYFWVDDIVSYHNGSQLQNALAQGKVDLSKQIAEVDTDFTPFHPPGNCLEANSISVSSFLLNEVILETSTDCEAILSTSDVYYTGWKVQIDGNDSPIVKSNLSFRAVKVPKGSHSIRFYYFPGIYLVALSITLIFVMFGVGSILRLIRISRIKTRK